MSSIKLIIMTSLPVSNDTRKNIIGAKGFQLATTTENLEKFSP